MLNLSKHHVDILSITPLPKCSKSEIEDLTKEAENNNPVAQYNLGMFYYFGHCIEENRDLSNKWIKKSAKLGDAESQFTLAEDYYSDQNYKRAFYWLTKSADQEHIKSISLLSTMYFNGEYVNIDYENSFKLFTRSMHKENSYDQHFLGYLYQNGYGIKKDYKQAIYWYKHSVAQNNSGAQNSLGIMHLFGIGTDKDQKKGFDLITKSAEQMDVHGYYSIGLMYAKGIHVDQDYQKSKKYLTLADDFGDFSDSAFYLKTLKEVNVSLSV
jgi:TPR repeat protein